MRTYLYSLSGGYMSKISTPKVEDIRLKPNMSVIELVDEMRKMGGFQASHMVKAIDILTEMLRDKNCITILAFPACIIATGLRGAIIEMLKRGYFDLIITTCGTLDHDVARVVATYHHGDFWVDDKELLKDKIHRLGNIFIPFDSYGPAIEGVIKELISYLEKRNKKRLPHYKIVFYLGQILDKYEKKEESIIWWAYKKKIPIIVPGLTDGAVGFQLWIGYQEGKIDVDVFADESLLSDIVWGTPKRKLGALIIGGGISKHHTIWWSQFADGLEYAVYVTTAVEQDGSLSGAQTREAISWRKISERAKHVTVWAEATLVLPLMVTYLISKITSREKPKMLSQILREHFSD